MLQLGGNIMVHRDFVVLMPRVVLLQPTLTLSHLTGFRPGDTGKFAVSRLDCHCVLDFTLFEPRCHTRKTKQASLFLFEKILYPKIICTVRCSLANIIVELNHKSIFPVKCNHKGILVMTRAAKLTHRLMRISCYGFKPLILESGFLCSSWWLEHTLQWHNTVGPHPAAQLC